MNGEDPTPEEADAMAAAELAFGLLDGPERLEAEQRASRDPAFAAAVARWRDHAMGLLAGPDEAPRPSLWGDIARRLPANDEVAPTSAAPRRPFGWPLAAAAAIVLGIVALRPAPPAPTSVQPVAARPAPPLVAVLRAKAGKATLAVAIDRTAERLATTPADLSIDGHDAELWVIPAGGKPYSLGVVDQRAPQWRAPPTGSAALLVPGATLAVSVEPRGGSPTGQPTGAVILTGMIAAA